MYFETPCTENSPEALSKLKGACGITFNNNSGPVNSVLNILTSESHCTMENSCGEF